MAVAVLFPTFESVKISAPYAQCLSNIKHQALAVILYASDSAERYPLRDTWMDATGPYLKDEAKLRCPEAPKGAYGYAFNAALSGAKEPRMPPETPLVYESVNPIRNASDLVASLPARGRHRTESGGKNNVGYTDGHAKAVTTP